MIIIQSMCLYGCSGTFIELFLKMWVCRFEKIISVQYLITVIQPILILGTMCSTRVLWTGQPVFILTSTDWFWPLRTACVGHYASELVK